MNETLKRIVDHVIAGRIPSVQEAVRTALDEGEEPESILHEALIRAMTEVGQLYEDGEYFVPEMLAAAQAMKTGLNELRPLLGDAEMEAAGRVVTGTVKGDLHDIGKNLVTMMLEGAGFNVVDMGTDVSPDEFVEAVQSHDAKLVGMSALLTTTMEAMESTIKTLREAGLGDTVKVMVGGAPLTAAYAAEIGADGYAPDANQAVKLAKKLIG
jgi:5-methyltetrahydrofolate--homocysteine methyltransferase